MTKPNYCSQCGEKLNPLEKNPTCPACHTTFYQNSKPAVGILIIKDDKVLVGRRGIEPYMGEYDTIGGFLEYGEDPLDGCLRETKEETGLDIKITSFFDIFMDEYGQGGTSILVIYYLAEIVGGELKAQDDVASLEWININDLPPEGREESGTTRVFQKLKDWHLSKMTTSLPPRSP